MGRVSEAEEHRRRRFVFDNYFLIPRPEMLGRIRTALNIELKERALRNYYRWAEDEMIRQGIFDKDKAALRLQLHRSLGRYQKIADAAAEDEEMIRKRFKKDKGACLDPEIAHMIKDLQYTQINAEKAIVQMLEKAGVTAKREEIDINLKAEWFVIFGQAHMAVAYDLIQEEYHAVYIERCKTFEGAQLDYLQDLVEGKVELPMPAGLIEGGEPDEKTERTTDRHDDVDREADTVLY